MTAINVVRPGMLTTVQDLGRAGHQHEGVPVGGAMDAPALRLANLLVGNPLDAAALEVTITGPVLEFTGDVLFTVTGADIPLRLDDAPVPMARVVRAARGSELSVGTSSTGCRAYIAFAGGIDVPEVLGSRSTYLRGELGGLDGRALRAGDVLPLGDLSEDARRLAATLAQGEAAHWGPSSALAITRSGGANAELVVRALRGHHFHALTSESKHLLFSPESWFRVQPNSDRMGYRLAGPTVALAQPLELITEPVAFGTVQLPPGGELIVLMAERQTTGGYPRVLEVATVDLPLLAQASPGARVRFTEVSLEEAARLYIAREAEFSRLQLTLHLQQR